MIIKAITRQQIQDSPIFYFLSKRELADGHVEKQVTDTLRISEN